MRNIRSGLRQVLAALNGATRRAVKSPLIPRQTPILHLLAALLLCTPCTSLANPAAPPQPPLQTVLDDAADFHARQEAAARLGRTLTPPDIDALITLLEQHTLPALDHDETIAFKDAVCTALDTQTAYPAKLPAKLIAMYHDKRHATAWRDYCIQHLNTACTRIAPDQKPAAYKTFWAATAETDSTIAGTALIALADHRQDSRVDARKLAQTAARIVADPQASSAARTTALQIAAELGEKQILPTARELASSHTAERPLRLSAIAAIGALGTPDDIPLLERYAQGNDHLLSSAAKPALQKLSPNP